MNDLNILNDFIVSEFKKNDIALDRIYFCPHHPDYDLDSFDRKPNPGMLLRAMKDYDLNLSESIFIGDQLSDMEAGIRAGIGSNYLFNSKIKESILPHQCNKIESLLDLIEKKDE